MLDLTDKIQGVYNFYRSLHHVKPDMLIIDKYSYKKFQEEIYDTPQFLKNITITIVPRLGNSEVKFYKRLQSLTLG